jgi:hypothetical protein
MSDNHPFEVDQTITLLSDWHFEVEHRFFKDRMWDALGCSEDPHFKAAHARHDKLIAEKHTILERGPEPRQPYELMISGQAVTKVLSAEPGPGDKKRLKKIDEELAAVWEPMWRSRATLPAGTEIEISLITPLPNFDDGVVRVLITATNHPGLQLKKDGGTFGKRSLVLRGAQFRHANFAISNQEPGRAPGT